MQPITGEKKKIFLSCGEVSGDMNAANLVRAVRELAPEFEFVAIGGDKLRAAGVRILYDSTNWGSIGFMEAVAKAPRVYPALRNLPRMFRDEGVDLFVPVDYRFFNMKAARKAKALGVPVVYFFAPVSWFGTGGKRFAQLAETVDLSLVALPLSLNDYRDAGANFEFIGHPLLDSAKPSMSVDEAHAFFGTQPGRLTIGLMPGSRYQEVKRLTPVFARTVKLLINRFPDARFLLFRATAALEPAIRRMIGDAPISIVSDKVYDFMELSDLLILCSGTATHEATILEKPMVVTYMVSRFTYWLAKKTVDPPFVALPNIIAGDFVVPEILQYECKPEAVATAAEEILSDSDARCKMVMGLKDVKARMGAPGALERAARRVVDAALGMMPQFNYDS